MQISFYVLGDAFISQDKTGANTESNEQSTASAVNAEAVLNFVCKLTQTVLKKSDMSLVIVDDDANRLKQLDTALWSFDPVSFVPHNLFLQHNSIELDRDGHVSASNNEAAIATTDTDTNAETEPKIDAEQLSAPVTLIANLPTGFDGVVLNLAATALPLTHSSILPDRVLEIITPDETSKQQGRDKYRIYRDLGFELKYFPIN